MTFSISSITSTIANNAKYIGIVITVLLVCIGLYYAFVLDSQTQPVTFAENEEHVTTASGKEPVANVMFFYANWCPHCKTAKPIWEEVSSEYTNKVINGYRLTFSGIDCTEKSEDTTKMLDAYGVEGYPTVKLIKDGQTIEFDASVTKDNLVQFLNTVV
jgi:thiol-disulfide isomerase/thioredoxin